jgi:hypothetical protein
MPTQFVPQQVKGLEEAYEDIKKLNGNARGIKIATWVTALSTAILAIVGVLALVMPLFKG